MLYLHLHKLQHYKFFLANEVQCKIAVKTDTPTPVMSFTIIESNKNSKRFK